MIDEHIKLLMRFDNLYSFSFECFIQAVTLLVLEISVSVEEPYRCVV